MPLSILQVVQEYCGLRGLPVPTSIVGSTERSAVQYLSVLKAVGRKAGQYNWQRQKVQGTFTAVAQANQGKLTTLFPSLSALEPGGMWNISRKIPVRGPVSDAEWAVQTALKLAGPPFVSWISQNQLFLSPIPEVGEVFSAIYQTVYYYADSMGSPKGVISADTDTFLFPDDVALKGFEAVWKKQVGEAYIDDENEFLDLISKGKLNGGMPTYRLDSPTTAPGPRIYIPIGNWPV